MEQLLNEFSMGKINDIEDDVVRQPTVIAVKIISYVKLCWMLER